MRRLLSIYFFASLLVLMMHLHGADPDGDPAHIYINLSVKVMKGGTDGPNPTGTQAILDATIAEANQVMDQQKRGIRFRMVERVVVDPAVALPSQTFYTGDVDNGNGTHSHPVPVTIHFKDWYQWYDLVNDTDPAFYAWESATTPASTPSEKVTFEWYVTQWENAMLANPTQFGYRTDVANVYIIFADYRAGRGLFPNGNHAQTNLFFTYSGSDVATFLHEFGHYSDLHHTFETVEIAGLKDAVGSESTDPALDITDTLPDAWDYNDGTLKAYTATQYPRMDQLSQRMFGQTYPSHTDDGGQVEIMRFVGDANFHPSGTTLYTADQLESIWLIWENLMSYHKGGGDVFTNWHFSDQQLDIYTDTYALTRPVATGRFWYAGGATTNSSRPIGTSKHSYSDIAQAVAAVRTNNPSGGDILLVRPGSYHPAPAANVNPFTISNPITIRATRAGAVTIYGH